MLSLHRIQPGIAARRGLLLAACAVLGACVLPTYEVTGGTGGGATSTGGTGGATSTLAGGGGTGGATTTSSTGGTGGAGGTGGSTGTSIGCPGMECVGWVHTYGESAVTYGLAVDASQKGVLVGGTFSASVNLDGVTPIASKGGLDGYGVQTDLDGNHVGSGSFAAVSSEPRDQAVTAVAYGFDVAGVADGSAILAGTFVGSIQLSSGCALAGPVGNHDGFVAKFEADLCKWAHPVTSSGDDTVKAVAVTPTGEIIVAGTFFDDGMAEIVGIPVTSLGFDSVEGFVLKLSATGILQWFRTFGGSGSDDDIDDVVVDAAGGVVVVGSYREQVYFDDGSATPLSGTGDLDGFAMRLQPDGAYHWARGFGGPGSQRVRGAAASPGNTVYLAGHFSDSLNLGNDSIPEDPANIPGQPDLFLIQTDITGQAILWKSVLWNVKYSGPLALDVAPDGGVGLACTINDTPVDLGGGNVVTPDGIDTLAVRFDIGHALQRYKLVSGTGYQIVNGGVFDPTGAFVLTGNLAGGLDLGYGDISVLTQGEIDAFVLKLDL